MNIRSVREDDRRWLQSVLRERWMSCAMVTRGRVHDASMLPGLVAHEQGENLGLLTYTIHGKELEIVSIDVLRQGKGIGSELIKAIVALASAAGSRRVWLVTTNDNTRALRFFQRLGFRITAIHRNAAGRARLLKQCIPLIGIGGVPIRDEIELEMRLADRPAADCSAGH